MAHSVEEHLHLQANEYDRIIRTFIPRYDEMMGEILRWLDGFLSSKDLIVDLGGGTGFLASLLAKEYPSVRIEIRDTDSKMIEIARERLKFARDRVTFVERSFHESLPKCQAVVATLSLHHVRELDDKAKLYRSIFDALGSPGVFLNGDCTMSAQAQTQAVEQHLWVDFMKSNGMTEEEVRKHFAEWESEDTYFSLSEELSALKSAGFPDTECFWKYGPMAIYGGIKK